MATPHVTGAAALLMANFPEKTPVQIKEAIINSAVYTPMFADRMGSCGRLDVMAAADYLSAPASGAYKLTYDLNGAPGTPPPARWDADYAASTIPMRLGYSFLGWSEDDSAAVPDYLAGEAFDLTANTTLYAVWSEMPLGTLDTAQFPNLDENAPKSLFKFVPTESGYYKFYSGGGLGRDPMGWLYDAEGNHLAANDDIDYYSGRNFRIIHKLTAGNIYYLLVAEWGDNSSFFVRADRVTDHVVEFSLNGAVGDPPMAQTMPALVPEYEIPWRLGYSFLGWSANSGASAADYLPGANISLSADAVLYAVWSAAPTLALNTDVAVNVDFYGQERYYKFTAPASGTYTFYSSGGSLFGVDPVGVLFDSEGNLLDMHDDVTLLLYVIPLNPNFSVSYELKAGETYYFGATAYGTGSYTARLVEGSRPLSVFTWVLIGLGVAGVLGVIAAVVSAMVAIGAGIAGLAAFLVYYFFFS